MFDLPYNLNIPLMLYQWFKRSSCESQIMFTSVCSIEFDTPHMDTVDYRFAPSIFTPPFEVEVYSSLKQMLEDLYSVDNGELDLPQFILSHGKNLIDFKDYMDEYALENNLGKFWETVNLEMKNIMVQKFS